MFRVERPEFGKQTADLWCGQVAASILQHGVYWAWNEGTKSVFGE